MFCGLMDSRDNAVVGSAAADVSLQCFLDGGGGWRGVFLEQSNAGHDHSGRAIAALHGVAIDEALLDGVELCSFCQAFNGGDLFVFRGAERNLAGAGWIAVEEDGTSSALPFSTAVFCSGEFKVVSEDKEERTFSIGVDVSAYAVNEDVHMVSVLRNAGGRRWSRCRGSNPRPLPYQLAVCLEVIEIRNAVDYKRHFKALMVAVISISAPSPAPSNRRRLVQESDESRYQIFGFASLAFPNNQSLPTLGVQRGRMLFVAVFVSSDFLNPVFAVRLGHSTSPSAIMTVPKAAMDDNNFSAPCKNYVGFARQALFM